MEPYLPPRLPMDIRIDRPAADRNADVTGHPVGDPMTAIFEHAAIGLGLLSPQGLWLEANNRLRAMLGYTIDELRGLSWMEVTHPEDLEKDLVFAWRLSAGEISQYTVEKRYLRRDGSIVEARVSIAPSGEDTFVAVIEDIAEHKRAARATELLARAGGLLAETLDFERTLSNVARLFTEWLADCCIVDPREGGERRGLRAIHADPAMSELMNALEQLALDGRSPSPGSAALRAELVPAVNAADLQRFAQSPEQLRILRELAPASLLVVPLLARGRRLGMLLLLCSDAERPFGQWEQHLAEELAWRAALAIDNAMVHAATERSASELRERVWLAAHDLRNPLNASMLASQLVLAKLPAATEYRSLREVSLSAQRAVRHAEHLIQDLLKHGSAGQPLHQDQSV